MNRTLNQLGIQLLKRLEGFSNVAYRDEAGVLTIGFGFTKNVQEGDTITPADAERRLKLELIPFEQCVNRYVHCDLTDNQFAALVCFCYNEGPQNFIDSTLLKLLNNNADKRICSQQFLRWDKIKVNSQYVVSRGLINRRNAEIELFLKGVV